MTPGKLTVGGDGRLHGPANLQFNSPWPCVNGSWGSGSIQGLIFHTMVGNLDGTVSVFNNPSFQASAHFGISQSGTIWQFGPIGKGWIAWAQMAGNATWYSCEMADNGDQHNPYTAEQIEAGAQLAECLSAYAGFPLQVTDDVNGRGLGTHAMGGQAWGGHTCPGPGPRAGQRQAIIDQAKAIRGTQGAPVTVHTTAGEMSLAQLAAQHKTQPAAIIRLTALHTPAGFDQNVAGLINGVFDGTIPPSARMARGLQLCLPTGQ